MNKDTGGPAFPNDRIFTKDQGLACATGMDLRDYFAAKAISSVSASNYVDWQFAKNSDFDWCAITAYKMADAMLRAREAA